MEGEVPLWSGLLGRRRGWRTWLLQRLLGLWFVSCVLEVNMELIDGSTLQFDILEVVLVAFFG